MGWLMLKTMLAMTLPTLFATVSDVHDGMSFRLHGYVSCQSRAHREHYARPPRQGIMWEKIQRLVRTTTIDGTLDDFRHAVLHGVVHGAQFGMGVIILSKDGRCHHSIGMVVNFHTQRVELFDAYGARLCRPSGKVPRVKTGTPMVMLRSARRRRHMYYYSQAALDVMHNVIVRSLFRTAGSRHNLHARISGMPLPFPSHDMSFTAVAKSQVDGYSPFISAHIGLSHMMWNDVTRTASLSRPEHPCKTRV
jgi:hypothetical protein